MQEATNKKVLRDHVEDICARLVGTVTNNFDRPKYVTRPKSWPLGRPDIFHGETYFRGRALDLRVDVGSADNMRTDNIFLHFTSQPIGTHLPCIMVRKRGRT